MEVEVETMEKKEGGMKEEEVEKEEKEKKGEN